MLDAETDPFRFGRVPEPFVWGAYDGERNYVWRDTERMVQWLENQDAIVYAHNGGKFDFHYLVPYLSNGQIMIINGRLAKLRIGKCELRDSYLILPMPLKNYQKDEINYGLMEAELREDHMDVIIPYMLSDCKYTRELIMSFRELHGDALTLAGAAMAALLEECGLDAPDTTEAYDARIRPYYRGGRTWAVPGVYKNVTMYDIVSAYPWAMAELDHPWGAVFDTAYGNKAERVGGGFYSVEVDGQGWLPYTDEEGKTIYPEGIVLPFDITGWELAAFEQITGERVEVKEALIPRETTNFKPFVEKFFAMKSAAKKGSPEYIIAKLTQNSSYGKFGSDPRKWKRYRLGTWGETVAAPKYVLEREIGERPLYSRLLTKRERKYWDIAVAASVTGAVRAKMMLAINFVGREYCPLGDTDSICKLPGGKELPYGGGILGSWEKEIERPRAWVAGRKMYVLGGDEREEKVRSKGVRLSAEEIKRVVGGEEITYKQDAPSFSISRGIKFIERRIKKND